MSLRRTLYLRQCACLALVLGAAGCGDQFERRGTWNVQNVNEANLAAMVVDKHDLVQGVGDDASPGELSAAAVRRLLTDHVKALPQTSLGNFSQTTASPTGTSSGPGGAGVY